MENKKKYRSYDSFHTLRILLAITILLTINPLYGKNKVSKGLETVVIDAGHGGKDPGAVVGNAREKDIVLGIALDLGRCIKEGLPNVRVIYTRSSDKFVPLFERSVIANKNNADLFISIHANFCSSPSVKGTETYVLGLHRTEDNLNVAKKENSVILLEKDYSTRYEGFNPNLSESYIMFELIQDTHIEQSVAFAGILQDSFLKHAQRDNRNVRQAGFLVLRETAMPGVLIETGYLSNKSEASYLMTEIGRQTIANSIFNSFKQYKERFESRLNLTSSQVPNEAAPIESGDSAPAVKRLKSQKETIARDEQTNTTKAQKSIPAKGKAAANESTEITFAIQLSAYPKKLPLNSKLFKGIKNISEFKVNGYYKYYCMESKSLTTAKKNLSLVKVKIHDAFIIAFRNGNPIPVNEALKGR